MTNNVVFFNTGLGIIYCLPMKVDLVKRKFVEFKKVLNGNFLVIIINFVLIYYPCQFNYKTIQTTFNILGIPIRDTHIPLKGLIYSNANQKN